MIDTIAFTVEVELGKDDLSFWDRTREEKADGRFNIVYRMNVALDNGATIRCTYYPRNYQGKNQLIIEFSLPKLVFGNNYTMLFDIEGAINKANEILTGIRGLPSVDLRQGVLSRLDVCYNHQVGDLVPHYIQALQKLNYSRRKTAPYSNEGVQFRNKQQSTKFYDKEKETNDPDAYGILRQERTLRSKALKKLLKDKKPTVGSVTGEFLLDVLEDDLRKLGIHNRSIATRDTALEILTNALGELAGYFYYGLQQAGIKYPSKEAIVAASKSHPRSTDRRLKKIIDAGVPMTQTETEQPLPPLVIDREMVQGMTRVIENEDGGKSGEGGSDGR